VDERGAKAAMYALNRVGRHFGELEEAWLVQALVREDGLSQVEVAMLLSRHKSWDCRRLAMIEKLCAAAQEDLRLGLLSPTMARQAGRGSSATSGQHDNTRAVAMMHVLAEARGVSSGQPDDQPHIRHKPVKNGLLSRPVSSGLKRPRSESNRRWRICNPLP
jgi:hypothetical protein